MSKVKIQGSASGSGVLTIQAPTTSTDRTITLPDATATLATTADSVGGANGVDFNDDVKARFGTGNDLELYHNGSNSIIKNSTGITKIQADDIRIQSADDSESLAKFVKDGGAELYHNDSKKLETTATGIAVTGGVAIGGTGSANTLDDYEEGTFTATLTATSSAPNTACEATGNYTKIGNWVNFTIFRFQNVDTTGASGEMRITGLPFTTSTTSITTNFATHQMNFDTSKFQWADISGTTISFLESTNGNSWTNWNITAGTGKYLAIAGSYKT